MTLPPILPRNLHGGPSSTPFRGLDFSVNTNPYGPNPYLLAAVQQADWAHYPDPAYWKVRQRLAAWHGVQPRQIALSTGASDLLHRCVRAFSLGGETLLSLHAPFGELARAAQLQGLHIRTVHPSNWQKGWPANTRLVYVGQPHNPTGHCLPTSQLSTLADACAATGAWLLLDLAYTDFLLQPPALPHHPAIIRLYSPGKAHGLVGARPAYAIASAKAAKLLDNLVPAWHLSAGTAALLAALPDPAAQVFLRRTMPQVFSSALRLARGLSVARNVAHFGTPYMLVEVGSAPKATEQLLKKGVRVRDCSSYGCPRHIRVSTQGRAADQRLLELLPAMQLGL